MTDQVTPRRGPGPRAQIAKLSPTWISEQVAHYVNGFDAAVPRQAVNGFSTAGANLSDHPMWKQGFDDYSSRQNGFASGKVSYIDKDATSSPEVRETRRCLVSQLRNAIADFESQKYTTPDPSARMRLMYTVAGSIADAIKEGSISRIPFVSRFVSPDPEAPKTGNEPEGAPVTSPGFVTQDS